MATSTREVDASLCSFAMKSCCRAAHVQRSIYTSHRSIKTRREEVNEARIKQYACAQRVEDADAQERCVRVGVVPFVYPDADGDTHGRNEREDQHHYPTLLFLVAVEVEGGDARAEGQAIEHCGARESICNLPARRHVLWWKAMAQRSGIQGAPSAARSMTPIITELLSLQSA